MFDYPDSHSQPIISMFGSGYVAEAHREETHFNLPRSERRELDFSKIMKSLRSALGLH